MRAATGGRPYKDILRVFFVSWSGSAELAEVLRGEMIFPSHGEPDLIMIKD
jgi:hypothetical protein